MTLTSHIAGKNATVRLYASRVEWERGAGLGLSTESGSKWKSGMAHVANALTSKKRESESLPLRSISHVGSKRDGMIWTKVVLTTSAGDVELRCTHADAKRFVSEVQRLMLA